MMALLFSFSSEEWLPCFSPGEASVASLAWPTGPSLSGLVPLLLVFHRHFGCSHSCPPVAFWPVLKMVPLLPGRSFSPFFPSYLLLTFKPRVMLGPLPPELHLFITQPLP